HILQGLDHLLFLITLLLPAVMYRHDREWRPVLSGSGVASNLLAIVTAFTVAHSLTLSLAVFGLLVVPAAWVEPAIALSVLLAALNNLWAFLPGPPWAIAFFLGLVHGLGFAFALDDLGLSATMTAIALAGFNLGVELGQLLVVLLILPVVFTYRATQAYRILGLQVGSATIAAVAIVWLVERSLHMQLIPL
ncbi:MAG: HupE/UreJ family protein, partial [Sedimenticolaceae bacterium]